MLLAWLTLSFPVVAAFAASQAYAGHTPPKTLTMLATASTALLTASGFGLWRHLLFGGLAVTLTFIAAMDIRHRLIPIWGCALVFLLGSLQTLLDGAASDWIVRVGGGLAAAVACLIIDATFRWLHKQSGLGLGDAFLLAGLGPWFAPPALALLALAGCGATLAIALVRGLKPSAALPLAPGLAASATLMLLASA